MPVGLLADAVGPCLFVSLNRACGLKKESIMQTYNSGRMLIHSHREDRGSMFALQKHAA